MNAQAATTPAPDDIAVILGGGGAWFYAQAAEVCTVFETRPDLLSKVRFIGGNSAGSITAVMFAAGIYRGISTRTLRDALASVTTDDQVITPSITRMAGWSLLLHPIDLARMAWGALFGASVVSQQPLWDLLEKFVGGVTTDDLKAKCNLTVQVRSFHSETGEGRVWDGYLANLPKKSSAIEALFMDHNGDSDGGPVDNCPADLAIQAGYQRILICYCGAESPPMPVKVYTTTKDEPSKPARKARAVAAGLLSALTQSNEQLTSERLAAWEVAGGQLVEAYPAQGAKLGSILDFSLPAQGPRVTAGNAAGQLALQRIKELGW